MKCYLESLHTVSGIGCEDQTNIRHLFQEKHIFYDLFSINHFNKQMVSPIIKYFNTIKLIV